VRWQGGVDVCGERRAAVPLAVSNHLGDGCPGRHTEALARLDDELVDREAPLAAK